MIFFKYNTILFFRIEFIFLPVHHRGGKYFHRGGKYSHLTITYTELHSPHSGFSRPQYSTRINHCYR
jgi:hypothetical protein